MLVLSIRLDRWRLGSRLSSPNGRDKREGTRQRRWRRSQVWESREWTWRFCLVYLKDTGLRGKVRWDVRSHRKTLCLELYTERNCLETSERRRVVSVGCDTGSVGNVRTSREGRCRWIRGPRKVYGTFTVKEVLLKKVGCTSIRRGKRHKGFMMRRKFGKNVSTTLTVENRQRVPRRS